MESLIDLRNEIDEIDEELIKMLEKRFDIVRKIKKCKMTQNINLEDLEREKHILSRIALIVEDTSFIDNLESIYGVIFSESKKIQR